MTKNQLNPQESVVTHKSNALTGCMHLMEKIKSNVDKIVQNVSSDTWLNQMKSDYIIYNTTHHKMWTSYSDKMQTPEISQSSKVHCKITDKLAFLVLGGRLQELQKEGVH